MSATIVKGIPIRDKILEGIREECEELKRERGITPGLATIQVGSDPGSTSYVASKRKTARSLHFYEKHFPLDDTISQEELLHLIDTLNRDPKIHGILVQLPLPSALEEREILCAIDPKKDVDGFHPFNVGLYTTGELDRSFIPCTPLGVIELLKEMNLDLKGEEVLIVGRSNLVGRPLATLLSQKTPWGDATVTLAHSRTKNLKSLCAKAKVLIVAVGSPNAIKGEWLSSETYVIDVGVNRIGVNSQTGKNILAGDVEYSVAKERVKAITPVPGGVGPMTIAMLMRNTLWAAQREA